MEKTLRNESLEQRDPLRRVRAAVWLCGLSGAGKTTLARELEAHLQRAGYAAYRLDGDELRRGLNSDLAYSRADRAENVRRIREVALLVADSGCVSIVAAITPYASDRAAVRARFTEQNTPLLEVFVDTPLEVCEARDPKGLYRRARAGLLGGFTGVDAPFEAPERPDLRLRCSALSPSEAAAAVMELLVQRGVISAQP